MLNPLKITPGHEELFIQRYERLRGWALHLTDNNREQAEDLLHDAFIQFTFTRPDLSQIHNLEGYLYVVLRNLHLSHERRASRQRFQQLSVIEYESIETTLRSVDPRVRLQAQDELRRVCHYACQRKEQAKLASVLLLRFFHGYYPSEIAQVLQSPRAAVNKWLLIARNEAKLYLENPKRLSFIGEKNRLQSFPPSFTQTTDDLANELRTMIFRSRQGDCLSREHLQRYYRDMTKGPIRCAHLAHAVSCPVCLDEINRLLRLPLLADRYPTDAIGKDTPTTPGQGGGSSSGSTGGRSITASLQRHARKAFEHRPQELCVAVNGFIQGSQRISSDFSELNLNINLAEQIGFVEIFSEQGIRLLLLSVHEPPPTGPVKRTAQIELSDGRTLELGLNFCGSWPTVHMVYRDPLWREVESVDLAALEHEATTAATTSESTSEEKSAAQEATVGKRFARFIEWLCQRLFGLRFWLQPGGAAAGLAVILIATLLLVRMNVPRVSAAELLRRSTIAEEKVAANPDLVLHRTINLEERRARSAKDVIIARRRIEVWQSASRGIKLRRLYDAQNNLVAGEWINRDGTSTVYRREAAPQDSTVPREKKVEAKAWLDAGDVWRLDPSAKDFLMLVRQSEGVSVEERAETYLLTYGSESATDTPELLRATLTLSKGDLRAVEQTLLIKRDGEPHEYRFTESDFERHQTEKIAPTVFQLEPELIEGMKDSERSDGRIKTEGGRMKEETSPVHPSSRILHPSKVASAELEIEVTYLLNQIKANLGEQVSSARTTGGALRVEALVETEGRKEEILRALKPVINNPAVIVDVSTIAEGLKRQQAQATSGDVIVREREVDVETNQMPADAELRRYFSARGAGSASIDEEIDQFANRVMNRSRVALQHASALKRLVKRFSPADVSALAPEAKSKWLAMIGEHAASYQRETERLRQELRPVFFPGAPATGQAANEFVDEANVVQAVERLLQFSHAHDEAVRSAFATATDGQTADSLKAPQFWRSLHTAERLAASIEDAYQK